MLHVRRKLFVLSPDIESQNKLVFFKVINLIINIKEEMVTFEHILKVLISQSVSELRLQVVW